MPLTLRMRKNDLLPSGLVAQLQEQRRLRIRFQPKSEIFLCLVQSPISLLVQMLSGKFLGSLNSTLTYTTDLYFSDPSKVHPIA